MAPVSSSTLRRDGLTVLAGAFVEKAVVVEQPLGGRRLGRGGRSGRLGRSTWGFQKTVAAGERRV